MKEKNILILHADDESLVFNKNGDSETDDSSLLHFLTGLGYTIDTTADSPTSKQLNDFQILVIVVSQNDLIPTSVEAIKDFVEEGRGLLVINNLDTSIKPLPNLNKLLAITGLKFQQYLNYSPTSLKVFQPHYITNNINKLRIGNIASINLSNGAVPLAFTQATRQPIIAYANMESGRVVAVGDVDLFSRFLSIEDNKTFIANTFCWLATHNVIDIQEITIPKTVDWGQSATVILKLRNVDPKARPKVKCVLESDADALIEPEQKSRSIPPGKTTRMQFVVSPQILGKQNLRLSIHIDDHPSLFFDQLLPEMNCLAPGYLTLEIKDTADELKTNFVTGSYFVVDGAFHWATEPGQLSCQLELKPDKGLIIQSQEAGHNITRWHLQAISSGSHNLVLRLVETGQTLPALITISPSIPNRLAEIKACYVYPLDAEIGGKLRQIDERLSSEPVNAEPFKILPPEDFINELYDGEQAQWLQGMLASARREQWYNPELLNHVLHYLTPTYLVNRGSFFPYDPALASSLARLHIKKRKHLEYNLLASEESEEIAIKQNVAANLLHEKYGHGFFYTQTRLGQQLAILDRHGLLGESGKDITEEENIAHLIRDSAIIANEGFAAWLELIFLNKLDRDIRQSVDLREIFLIKEATGLYWLKQTREFFKKIPPRFDSRYREGFEYLDYISRTFNLYCAVRMFMISTNIDFGIAENLEGYIQFSYNKTKLKQNILEPTTPDWRSHSRLREIAELLYQHEEKAEKLIQNQHCPDGCRQSGCPLEAFIEKHLEWRA
jgi:hypothetical protein